ncbi:MAG: 2-keto-4-pentenoate hydratase, partial [Halieaceae bacterium MED-G27]
NMLYKPATILEELNQFLTLEDGDIVMTGTPAGVGPVLKGQQFEGQVQVGSTVLTRVSWQAA